MSRIVLRFLVLFVGTSLLLIAVSVPLALGRVKRNPFYGVRTAKTLQSDAAWYAGNAYGGRLLSVAGVVDLIAVVLLACVPALRTNSGAYSGACGIIIVGSILAASALILRRF